MKAIDIAVCNQIRLCCCNQNVCLYIQYLVTGSIFNGFDTNFNSVVVFGEAKEVNDTEKRDGLKALLNKFLELTDLRQHEDEGIKYIDNSLKMTKLVKIEIKHISGKRGIKENIKIKGKQH